MASTLTPTELAAWAGLLHAHRSLVAALDADLERAHGLSLTSFDVLVSLAGAPRRRLRMAELAQSVLLTRSGLTRLVDRLERAGLVRRVRCEGDARGLYAELTETGLRRLRDAAPTHLAGVRKRFADRLAPDDVARLADIWRRLAGAN